MSELPSHSGQLKYTAVQIVFIVSSPTTGDEAMDDYVSASATFFTKDYFLHKGAQNSICSIELPTSKN